MVLHNPNNWHWVNKDATEWAKQWLEDKLANLSAKDADVTARIDNIVSLDGDVDVSQRKGKVITIYDFKLVVGFSGTVGNQSATGTITIPEVAHDTEEHEYVFDIDVHSDSEEKQPIKDLVRSKLVPQLREELSKLPHALIDEHKHDIQHSPGSNPLPNISNPKPHIPESRTPNIASPHTSSDQVITGSIVNTVTVTDTEEFRTTAEEMFRTFTDPDRLAAFTRAPPKLFDGVKPGGKFELFGGNVSGEFLELESPVKIVQRWRLDQWPAGHHSQLQIIFDQNDVDHVTVMRVTWTGVPVGQAEVTKRNWSEYYVRSIKKTFGFGSILY